MNARIWIKLFICRTLPIGLAAAAVFISGCSSTARRGASPKVVPARFTPVDLSPLDSALSQHPVFEYKLGPGDAVDIEVIGEAGTRATSLVGPDGRIYYYLLPGIDVWGLTLPEARERIVQEMQRVVREQQPVSLTLRRSGSQRVWLLGRLHRPGIYSMSSPMTLLEALSEAGGPTSVSLSSVAGASSARKGSDNAADLNRAFIMRAGKMLWVDFDRLLHEGDLSNNVYLRPDDVVYLPGFTSPRVHVLGAVASPRAIDHVNPFTLLQAVAGTGGVLPQAHVAQVAIVRGPLAYPGVALVDMKAIRDGQAPDVALEPNDIVYIPRTLSRDLRSYLALILDAYARTITVTDGLLALHGGQPPPAQHPPPDHPRRR